MPTSFLLQDPSGQLRGDLALLSDAQLRQGLAEIIEELEWLDEVAGSIELLRSDWRRTDMHGKRLEQVGQEFEQIARPVLEESLSSEDYQWTDRHGALRSLAQMDSADLVDGIQRAWSLLQCFKRVASIFAREAHASLTPAPPSSEPAAPSPDSAATPSPRPAKRR